MKTAGIINGFDFIGCDITLKFLAENYRVKATVPVGVKNHKPLINSGLIASDNLQILHVDMNNPDQLSNFVSDCDCLIHCGTPFQLNVKITDGPVFIPLISHTGNILKTLYTTPVNGKIIFLTSVAVFYNSFAENEIEALKTLSPLRKSAIEKAHFHSEKIIDNTIGNFTGNNFEIMVIAPAIIKNNILTHTRESTQAGLNFLFHNRIDNDKVFRKLAGKYLFNKMLEVNDVPGQVFNLV